MKKLILILFLGSCFAFQSYAENIVEEIDERTPSQIVSKIEELDKQSEETLKAIKELL